MDAGLRIPESSEVIMSMTMDEMLADIAATKKRAETGEMTMEEMQQDVARSKTTEFDAALSDLNTRFEREIGGAPGMTQGNVFGEQYALLAQKLAPESFPGGQEGWDKAEGEQKQKHYQETLNKLAPITLRNDPFGVDYNQGKALTFLTSLMKGSVGGITRLGKVIAPESMTGIQSLVEQIPSNPEHGWTQAGGRIGGEVLSFMGTGGLKAGAGKGYLGRVVSPAGANLAAQGIGGTRGEAEQGRILGQPWTPEQMAVVGVTNAVANALLAGLTPTFDELGKLVSPIKKQVLGRMLLAGGGGVGLNITQGAADAQVKKWFGLQDTGAWEAIKNLAASKDTWAIGFVLMASNAIASGGLESIKQFPELKKLEDTWERLTLDEKAEFVKFKGQVLEVDKGEAIRQAEKDYPGRKVADVRRAKRVEVVNKLVVEHQALLDKFTSEMKAAGAEDVEIMELLGKPVAEAMGLGKVEDILPSGDRRLPPGTPRTLEIPQEELLGVSSKAQNQPLPEKVKEILPPGVKPQVLTGEQELALSSRVPEKSENLPEGQTLLEPEKVSPVRPGEIASMGPSVVDQGDFAPVLPPEGSGRVQSLKAPEEGVVASEQVLVSDGVVSEKTEGELKPEEVKSLEDIDLTLENGKTVETTVDLTPEGFSTIPDDQKLYLSQLGTKLREIDTNLGREDLSQDVRKTTLQERSKLTRSAIEVMEKHDISAGDTLWYLENLTPPKEGGEGTSRYRGYIATGDIIDMVSRGAKWTGARIGALGHWAKTNLGPALSDFPKFAKTMVSTFSAKIRPTLRKVWDLVTAEGHEKVTKPEVFVKKLPLSGFFEERANRILRLGVGKTLSREVTNLVRSTDDRMKEITAKFSDQIDPAKKLTSKAWKQGQRYFAKSKDYGDYAIRNFVDAVEFGGAVPSGLQPALDVLKTANKALYSMFQLISPESVAQGKVLSYMTHQAVEIIRRPHTTLWKRMVDSFYDANKGKMIGLTRQTVEKKFLELSEAWSKGNYDAISNPLNQEFHRFFQVHPSQLRWGTLLGGKKIWIDLYHHEPGDYFRIGAERTAARVAMREKFGDRVGELRSRLGMESPEAQRAFNSYLESVHGFEPDNLHQVLSDSIYFAERYLGSPLRGSGLSVSAIGQLPEFVTGTAAVIGGAGKQLKAAMQLLDKGKVREMLNAGTIARLFLDFSFDSSSPVSSLAKLSGSLQSTGNWLMNHAQGWLAGSMMDVAVQEMKVGHAKAYLPEYSRAVSTQVLRLLGFDLETARRMARGKGTDVEYGMALRKGESFFTSGRRGTGETSELLAQRLWKSLVWFSSYPAKQMNVISRTIETAVDAAARGTQKERLAAAHLFAKNMFYTGVQGSAVSLLYAWLYSGFDKQAIYQKGKEFVYSPATFAVESLAYGIGGPITLLYKLGTDWAGSESLKDQVPQFSRPISIGFDFADFMTGKGQYSNLSGWDRGLKFLSNNNPAFRLINTFVAMDGLGAPNPELDTAQRAFYRWGRRNGVARVKMEGGDKDSLRETSLRASKILKSNGDPTKLYLDELKVKPGDYAALASSLRGRRLLADLNEEQRVDLKKFITDEQYELLEEYDTLLDAWASQYQEVETVGKFEGGEAQRKWMNELDPMTEERLKDLKYDAKVKTQNTREERESMRQERLKGQQ